jgi:hypothetical protein
MKTIFIEKIAEVKGGLPARKMEDHISGQDMDDNLSIPIEYNLEGYLIGEIESGKSVIVDRTKRNGLEIRGVFTTSRVTEVSDSFFKTANSVYRYKYL